MSRILTRLAILIAGALMSISVMGGAAAQDLFNSGKLLATGGVTNIEGAGGGGIATWALITGYETRDAVGANAHYNFVSLPDFTLHTTGVSVGLYDRVELSYSHLWFDTGNSGAKLGLGTGFTFQQDIFGLKVKVLGDAVYDQDSLLPQIAVGTQYKVTDHADILRAVGAKDNAGIDFYVAATKLFLDQSILVDTTLRATKSNQLGILGFGGPRNDDYRPEFEGSIAYLFAKDFAVGAEYRTKQDNLGFTKENDWKDLFLAYFVNKHASLTLAYVDLGTIATFKDQRGFYLSAQVGF